MDKKGVFPANFRVDTSFLLHSLFKTAVDNFTVVFILSPCIRLVPRFMSLLSVSRREG